MRVDPNEPQIPDTAPPPDLKHQRRAKAKAADDDNLHRVPPHSTGAEQAHLGCFLLDASLLDQTKVGPDTYYDPRHATIFATMMSVWQSRRCMDLIVLHQALADHKMLEACGGLAYLSQVADSAPSAANLPYYENIITEKWMLRKIQAHCRRFDEAAMNCTGEVAALVDQFESEALMVSGQAGIGEVAGPQQLARMAVDHAEKMVDLGGKLDGIGTGIRGLDNLMWGMRPGELTVVAARPSVGKTALGMQIAEFVACELKIPTGVFSLEMTKQQLMFRSLCSMALLDSMVIRKGIITEADMRAMNAAATKISTSKLHIDDDHSPTIGRIRAKARRMHKEFGVRFFVIDYLQIIQGDGRQKSREQEVAKISMGLKAMSKELECPVVVLAQLNRGSERDRNRRPRISDLRESGQIEADADNIGLLWRPDEEGEESTPAGGDDQRVNLTWAKCRNGRTGEVPMVLRRRFTRFYPVDENPSHTP